MWKQLETFTAVVQEGVKEFSETAIGEVAQSVESLQLGATKVVETALDAAKHTNSLRKQEVGSSTRRTVREASTSSAGSAAATQPVNQSEHSLYASGDEEAGEDDQFGQPIVTMQERLRKQHSPTSSMQDPPFNSIGSPNPSPRSSTIYAASQSCATQPALPSPLAAASIPTDITAEAPTAKGANSEAPTSTHPNSEALTSIHPNLEAPSLTRPNLEAPTSTHPSTEPPPPFDRASSIGPNVQAPASTDSSMAARTPVNPNSETTSESPSSDHSAMDAHDPSWKHSQAEASAAEATPSSTNSHQDVTPHGPTCSISQPDSRHHPAKAEESTSGLSMPQDNDPAQAAGGIRTHTAVQAASVASPARSTVSQQQVDDAGDAESREALSERLSWAQSELVKRTCAFNDMKKAYEQVKVLLDHSMQQIERLSTEIVALNSKADFALDEADKSAAAAEVARHQAASASGELAQTKQQLADTRKALAKAEAAVQAKASQEKQATVDVQDLEDMRLQLATTVRKMAAAIEAKGTAEERAAAAEASKASAEAARAEAEKLRREAQAQAQAAIAAAEAERNTRAEAVGMSEALKQESERRARVFNAAVKAAVGRLQKELEEDREELQGQLSACQELLQQTRQQLQEALAAAEEAQAESAQHSREAQIAASVAEENSAAAERARTGEAEARQAAQSADTARNSALQRAENAEARSQLLEKELEELRQQRQDVRAQLKTLQQNSAGQISELMNEKETIQQRLVTLMESLRATEQQSSQQAAAGRAALDKAQREAEEARKQLQHVEVELQQLRTSKNVASMFTLPSKQDVLAGLGLELMGNEQVRWKTEESDLEVGPSVRAASKAVGGIAAGSKRYLGAIPLRLMLLIGYLVILHVTVMISFTHEGADVSEMTKCERLLASGVISVPPRLL